SKPTNGATSGDFEAALFVREEWTLFRQIGTLSQKAGVPPERIRRLMVKELADNAADTGSECHVALLSDDGYVVEDHGPGIAPELVPTLFSIRRPYTSSKQFRLPRRGALGNGLRVVTGAVLASGGRLEVWTQGQRLCLYPQDSGETLVIA